MYLYYLITSDKRIMDYLEVEGKAQLARFGIPVNKGFLLTDDTIPKDLTFPCVLKGQILSGKRGKAGAVRVVKSKDDFVETKKAIEKISINGKHMEGILACNFLPIEKEYYIGLTLDVKNRAMALLFTTEGGMDIEELAATSPEKILKMNCTKGFDANIFKEKIKIFKMNNSETIAVTDIAEKLTKACFELDATTIEINPLAVLKDGSVIALDSKLVIDDNGLYRQGDYTLLKRTSEKKSKIETEAKKYDLTYVEIDPEGNIGTMAGGAGIGMATIDTIRHYGGRVNNFLDLGGGVTAEKTYQAMKILLSNETTNSILINVFGGINNCADMAEGIARAYKESDTDKTIVVKSRGFNQEEGWKIYSELGFPQTKYGTTDEAVKKLLGLEEEK